MMGSQFFPKFNPSLNKTAIINACNNRLAFYAGQTAMYTPHQSYLGQMATKLIILGKDTFTNAGASITFLETFYSAPTVLVTGLEGSSSVLYVPEASITTTGFSAHRDSGDKLGNWMAIGFILEVEP